MIRFCGWYGRGGTVSTEYGVLEIRKPLYKSLNLVISDRVSVTEIVRKKKQLLIASTLSEVKQIKTYVRIFGRGTRLCLFRTHSALVAVQLKHGSLRSHLTWKHFVSVLGPGAQADVRLVIYLPGMA